MYRARKIMVLAVVTLLVAACGAADEATEPATTESGEAESATEPADESGASDEGVSDESASDESDAWEEVFAAVEGLDREDRWDALLDLAEANGTKLTVYGSMGAADWDPLMNAFLEAVDNRIDAEHWRGGGDAMLQRIAQEHDAGRPQADVVFTSARLLEIMAREEFLQEFDSPIREDIPESAQNDYGLGAYINVYSLLWNKNLVDGEEVFDTWEDALRYTDSDVGIQLRGVEMFSTLVKHWQEVNGWEEEEAVDVFREANLWPVDGRQALAEFTAAGQTDLAIGLYVHNAEQLGDDSPLAWEGGPEPLFIRWNGNAPMKTASNPAAALLFIDFVSDTPGQDVMVSVEREPANRNVTGAVPAIHDYELSTIDEVALVENQAYWDDLWLEVIGHSISRSR